MYWEYIVFSQYMGGLKWKPCYKKSRALASARVPPLVFCHCIWFSRILCMFWPVVNDHVKTQINGRPREQTSGDARADSKRSIVHSSSRRPLPWRYRGHCWPAGSLTHTSPVKRIWGGVKLLCKDFLSWTKWYFGVMNRSHCSGR